jgi:DNA repair exonuclease SbcCD ATPase subunit
MGDANQTQRAIEETTGLTWDVFTNSIYIGQYEVTTLLYGTDKQRKELFSRFLGLERFIKTQERIRADVRKNQDEQSSLRNQVEIAKGRAEELDSAVVLADKAIGTKQAKPDYEVDLARREVRKLNDEIAHLDNWLRVNQSQFEISLDSGYKADAAKEQAERQLTKLDDIPGKCPTCGAVMSIKTREKHEHELRKEIAEQEILSEAFEAEKSKNRKQRKPKMDRLQACRLRIRDIQNLEVEHKLWSQAEVQRKEQQRLLQEAKARRKDWLEKAKAHEALLEELCDSQRFLEACLKAVSREGLPSYLCSNVCGRLNAATRRYSDLFTEGEIRVRFKIEAGELDLELVNAHGGIGLRDQSMGELRLAALIAIFAFRELLVPCNVLFLDEPLEGVDSVGAYRIGALLNEVCKRVGGSIFLTTHNPHLLSGLEPARHLEIVKRNGVSTVKEIQ